MASTSVRRHPRQPPPDEPVFVPEIPAHGQHRHDIGAEQRQPGSVDTEAAQNGVGGAEEEDLEHYEQEQQREQQGGLPDQPHDDRGEQVEQKERENREGDDGHEVQAGLGPPPTRLRGKR